MPTQKSRRQKKITESKRPPKKSDQKKLSFSENNQTEKVDRLPEIHLQLIEIDNQLTAQIQ